MLGIYVHIPFCEKKCNYCAFSSFADKNEERKRYINSLIEEINSLHKKYVGEKYRSADTIYFGGGTPSILSKDEFLAIKDAIFNNFSIENVEFTVECNPNSLTEDKLKLYKSCGMNRLSIGVQTLSDDGLKAIGRLHNSEMAKDAITLAKKYIDNISADLIIGLPGMSEDKLKQDIDTLIKLGVKHISSYMLQVEEGTPLEKMVLNHEIILPDDEDVVNAYESISKYLKERGLDKYEVSNFAFSGYESKHNFKYWTGEEYVGFGLGAHSYLHGTRIANSKNFKDYYSRNIDFEEVLNRQEKLEEHIMLGLRCKNGINLAFLKENGYDITKSDRAKEYLDKGILTCHGERYYLNPNYYSINNYIIASLICEI